MNTNQAALQQDSSILSTDGRRGLDGSTLKLIAIISMLIDHIAATILERMIMARGFFLAANDSHTLNEWMAQGSNGVLYITYTIMRLIGRFGFPLFCFLLVEGFLHTRSKIKYAVRLFLFCLISEVPFDLAFAGKWYYPDYQNVFFTLLIGFLAMWAYEWITTHSRQGTPALLLRFTGYAIVLALTFMLAEYLQTDYGGMGVLTISLMYALRKNKAWSMTIGCITLTVMQLSEITAFLMVPVAARYNGKRGLRIKYFFYLFYPLHLALLYFICVLTGIA